MEEEDLEDIELWAEDSGGREVEENEEEDGPGLLCRKHLRSFSELFFFLFLFFLFFLPALLLVLVCFGDEGDRWGSPTMTARAGQG